MHDFLTGLGNVPNLDHAAALGMPFLSMVLMKLGAATPKGGACNVVRGGIQVSMSRRQLADLEDETDDAIDRVLGQYDDSAQDALLLAATHAARPLADILD